MKRTNRSTGRCAGTATVASSSLVALLLGACASYATLPPAVRNQLATSYRGRTVELRQSCYYGDLYDDNTKYLLSPYPFADTSDIVDLDGTPIHPKNQQGIAPAGTDFVVQKIEFPDVGAMAKRMLTTPRYNPWVYLTPLANSSSLPRDRVYVLVLPRDMHSETQARRALQARLAPPGEVTRWLAKLRPTVQVAIAHKDVHPGMSTDAMVAALGFPMRWLEDTSGAQRMQVAWYDSQEVWLENDHVVKVRPGRKLPPLQQDQTSPPATTAAPASHPEPPAL